MFHVYCVLIGAISNTITNFSLGSDLALELVNYQCAGGENNISLCMAMPLAACLSVATVRCQGKLFYGI